MRLFYDHPELKLNDLALQFLDFRQRLSEFPSEVSTPLIAIPTTSGTGSEVTPFAVLKDNIAHKKISLIDETLLPNIAIIDANLTRTLPHEITVDTAFDALTHALEALVSSFATDYTDGLALEAMRLIFEALPETLKNPSNVLWRHKMHNAACLAGMAIGNASVGVNHALAHSIGAKFGISHGHANSMCLLSTLAFNSRIPHKFVAVSGYPLWVADQKYARAAQFLGLDSAEGKHSNDQATRERLNLALQRAVFDLASSVGQPMSIAQTGISKEEFERAIPELVIATLEDMSIRTNPGMPTKEDVVELLLHAYSPRQRP
jgi:acetaldehyde dehydrogenase/alcohol dehydrogenase